MLDAALPRRSPKAFVERLARRGSWWLAIVAMPLYADTAEFPATALAQDIAAWRSFVAATHPDPRYTADVRHLDRVLRTIERQASRPLTREQFWRLFAKINPLLADGHWFIGLPNWRDDTRTHLAKGGQLFPFEVELTRDGSLQIVSALGGAASPYDGRTILAVDGTPTRSLSRAMLAMAHGDTAAFRQALVARRWWLYDWKLNGSRPTYTLTLAAPNRQSIRVPGSTARPAMLQDEDDCTRAFTFDIVDRETAVLTVKTFSWGSPEEFYAFAEKAFAQIQAAAISRLIIDVSENGGGDDELWMRGLLRYVADKPYRWASAYRKKVLERHQDPGEKVGDVVSGVIGRMIEPELDHPLRFRGRVFVRIGPRTYSSAILFANVVRDYQFATLIGSGDAARSGQTGGVQVLRLPNTGLIASVPRFILSAPAGGDDRVLLRPDAKLALH